MDDNRTNREQTAYLLQRDGFEVFQADTEADAVRQAEQEDLGVVLIDNIVGGLEAAWQIQQIRPFASIVIYSASAEDPKLRARAEVLQVYISDWIEKSARVVAHLKEKVAKESVKAGLREHMETASGKGFGAVSSQLSSLRPEMAQEILRELSAESARRIQSSESIRLSRMQEIAASIEVIYDRMRDLVERRAGQPGLRDELRPLREELRVLQEQEAVEIAQQYDSHFRPNYEQARELIRRAREVFGE